MTVNKSPKTVVYGRYLASYYGRLVGHDRRIMCSPDTSVISTVCAWDDLEVHFLQLMGERFGFILGLVLLCWNRYLKMRKTVNKKESLFSIYCCYRIILFIVVSFVFCCLK